MTNSPINHTEGGSPDSWYEDLGKSIVWKMLLFAGAPETACDLHFCLFIKDGQHY